MPPSIQTASIFLKTGGVDTQLKIAQGGTPVVQEVTSPSTFYTWLHTGPGGLVADASGGAADASDVATGLAVPAGGFTVVERLAVGAYDVSVQFKQDSALNSNAVQKRYLEVFTVGFGAPTMSNIKDAPTGSPLAADYLADASKLGLSAGGLVRRGASVIATAQVINSTSYIKLATPDIVSGVNIDTAGDLMVIYFSALWHKT